MRTYFSSGWQRRLLLCAGLFCAGLAQWAAADLAGLPLSFEENRGRRMPVPTTNKLCPKVVHAMGSSSEVRIRYRFR
jgi:hypothetical protein